MRGSQRLYLLALGVAIGFLLMAFIRLPWTSSTLGQGDFTGYWAASRLLFERRDPFDSTALEIIEHQVSPDAPLIYTWNPPWALVLLLPVSALPYPSAAQAWLTVNLVILASAGGWLWYRISGQHDGRGLLLAMLASVFFLPTLAAIAEGQVVPWVLLGAIGFEWFWQQGQFARAGASLILALIKPQVTFLCAAYGVSSGLIHRRWRFFGGALATVLLSMVVLTVLFPGWLISYWHNISGRSLMQWQTPTLGGLLYTLWPENWLRFLGLAAVLFIPWLTKRWERIGSVRMLTESLLFGAVLAPFGWSYDQIVLLPAIIQILYWRRQLSHPWVVDLGLAVIYIVPFLMRLASLDDFKFFWVPLMTLILYMWAARQCRIVSAASALKPIAD